MQVHGAEEDLAFMGILCSLSSLLNKVKAFPIERLAIPLALPTLK